MSGIEAKIPLKPFPKYGDLMTLEEFISDVQSGCLIDYDGHGRYATAKGITDIIVRPSDVLNMMYSKCFTHVMWFNR